MLDYFNYLFFNILELLPRAAEEAFTIHIEIHHPVLKKQLRYIHLKIKTYVYCDVIMQQK